MKELVSIVVPIYNMGASIEKCVESVLKQNYKNLEIILVDDGSTDDTLARCEALALKDNRVFVYHTENRGSGPARNYGIEHATGRYIFFPDADDYLETDAISVMVDAMQGGKFDLVVFGYKKRNQKGIDIQSKQYKELALEGVAIRMDYSDYANALQSKAIQGAPWNKFFDLRVIQENKIEYPALRRHQDEGFIARYMCYAKHVHFIEAVLYVHYVNDLKKEWQKYPVDYIDAVIGLYETRKDTILSWNVKDKLTHDIITHEYICKVIKSMELTFSPKHKLNALKRAEMIKKYSQISGICDIYVPDTLGQYQRIVLKLLRKKRYTILYMVLYAKICVEKAIR